MFKIRSSTLFRILCWAIGLMAVGLLAMVALMVYPLLFGGNVAQANPDIATPPTKSTVTPLRVQQDFNTMQIRFWPPEPDEGDELDVPGDAVDTYEKTAFVGGAFDGSPNDCAVFQNQTDRKQWVVFLNQQRNGVKLLTITDKLAVVDFGGQKVKLNRTKALAAKVKRTTRRGRGSSSRGRTSRASRTSRSSSSSRSTASSSVRTYGRGASSRSSSGRTSTSRSRTPNSRTSSASASSAVRRTTGATTPASASRPASSTGAGSSGAKTSAGVNWRKYWNDRMKKRNQQK